MPWGVIRGIGDDDTPGADSIALMRNQLPIREQFSRKKMEGGVVRSLADVN